MARAKRAGDIARNARRRFVRQSSRLLQKADKAVGAAKSRYQQQALESLEQAVSLYDDSFDLTKAEKPIRDIAQKLNVDLKTIAPAGSKLKVIVESFETLETPKEAELNKSIREKEAKAILSRGNVKNRFYGGLIDIWQGLPVEERDAAILERFGAETLLDVIEELLKADIDIYKSPKSEEMYENVRVKTAHYEATKE